MGFPDSREKAGLLNEDYYPGDVGFDPLGLKPTDPEAFAEMQTKELQNGRLAMLAAAGFLAQELVNHKPILETLKLLILLDDSEISKNLASTSRRATSRRWSSSSRPRRRTRSSKREHTVPARRLCERRCPDGWRPARVLYFVSFKKRLSLKK